MFNTRGGGNSSLTFSQFLSATMSPSVARVSAPRMIPSLKRQPTMVVPVLVAFGSGIPRSARKLFLSRAGEIVLWDDGGEDLPDLIRKVETDRVVHRWSSSGHGGI